METVKDHQVLKDLALEFEESGDPLVFNKIIRKVHWLLKYIIAKARKSRPYLYNVDFYDLYQTAVIGLYRAVAKVKVDEHGSKLIYNIRRYVVNEIIKDYKDRSKYCSIISFEIAAQRELIDTKEVYKNLEMEFIRDRFYKLIDEDVISSDEFKMVWMWCVLDMSYSDIARQVGSSVGTISKKVRDSLNRIRWEFRRRNWEGF